MLDFYKGVPLEKGGTSIAGKESPAVRWLYDKHIKGFGEVLDYGAGKYARNADFLRNLGVPTFAYDPYNFNCPSIGGWNNGLVSGDVCLEDNNGYLFNICLTSFVLNVLPKNEESAVIEEISKLSKKSLHVVRNLDIYDTVLSAINRKDKVTLNFIAKEYPQADPIRDLMDICVAGVQTSRGFQRITSLEEYGFVCIKKQRGYKIYSSI